ncbi:DUF1700 domain-containing protein [Vagococcus sp. BWB3-3]|uniref:DUF1700 domain-containing protein n=1 Tax=Vagococcus allomyrinae TaxID=2794353 RepID=A0A940SXX4_9ENTE|nr:DUF1700 domain-containing protein [Vagococcus allomyrinae]MBP1043796.1 DUF1700 domain-containing protein [Vagococcus allomyrinae]
MRKVNIFAVIGLFFFNLVVMLGAVITIYALLASAWIVAISFIASPALLVLAALSGLQAMSVVNLISSILLATLAFISFPLLTRVSALILTLSRQYIDFNKAMIYR